MTLLDVAAKEAKLILVCKEMYDFFYEESGRWGGIASSSHVALQ